jgi:isopropylmalate/homocitrate/citramalate synthase
MTRAREIRVVEVGPRDGLQNERAVLPVASRIALIRSLAEAGLETIEAGSFVSAGRVPQMAGSDAVLQGASAAAASAALRLPVLVPNRRGLADAVAAGARDIAVFAAASETFSRKNLNRSIAQSLADYGEVVGDALAAGIAVRGYVSCVLGCPFEGAVPTARVVAVAEAFCGMGCTEVALGDTIGIGTPDRARALVAEVARAVGVPKVALHFHDTYGQALANVLACLDLGIATVDSAVAGLGGCPFAPGGSGNLATEDLVFMLEGLGVETGIDIDAVAQTGRAVCAEIGAASRSRAGIALAPPIKDREGACSTPA